jgi:chromosomal replication initiator protein
VEQPIELTAETLWTEVSGRLKGALNDSTYRTWFGEVEGHEVSDEVFVLAVPNDFTREWIEGHFLELIRAAVRDATGQQRRIQLTVAETGAGVPDVTQPLAQRISESGLNTKYTFDLFVIGSSNRFRARGRARSRRGAGAGLQPALHLRLDRLGKTHLLQAIAQYVMEHPGTCR